MWQEMAEGLAQNTLHGFCNWLISNTHLVLIDENVKPLPEFSDLGKLGPTCISQLSTNLFTFAPQLGRIEALAIWRGFASSNDTARAPTPQPRWKTPQPAKWLSSEF